MVIKKALKDTDYMFAAQWLHHLGNKIFIGDQQILKYEGEPDYPTDGISTKLSIGFDFDLEYETRQISEMQLKQYGFGVAKRQNKKNANKSIHYITRDRNLWVKFPKDLMIDFDEKNKRVRLVGGQSDSSWEYLVEDKYDGSINDIYMHEMIIKGDKMIDHMMKTHMDERLGIESENLMTIDIPEIPLIITPSEELVCIDDSNDMENICIVGDRGTHKTNSLLRLGGSFFYKFHYWVANLNDSLSQLHMTSLPQYDKKWVSFLSKIGEVPSPMPTINLYVAANGINVFLPNKVGFIYPMSFSHFLHNYTFYTEGIERYHLKGTETYMNEYINQLSKTKTVDEFMDVLEELPMEEKNKRAMFARWKPKWKQIFEDKFFDSVWDNPMASSKWTLETYDGKKYTDDPMIICLKAGLFVNLPTSMARNLANGQLFNNVMTHRLRMIQQYQQIHRHDLNNERIMIMIDEFQDFFGKKLGSLDPLESITLEIAKQGRSQNIGYLYTTQNYSKIPLGIRQNNTLTIIGQIGSIAKDRKELIKDLNLSSSEDKVIQTLDKSKREIIVYRKKPFIVYDKFGRKREGDNYYRGFLIPPNCATFKPGKQGGNNNEVEEAES